MSEFIRARSAEVGGFVADYAVVQNSDSVGYKYVVYPVGFRLACEIVESSAGGFGRSAQNGKRVFERLFGEYDFHRL